MVDQEFERVVQEGMASLKKSRERLKADRDKPKEWEEITPEPLKPAVKHIQREFKTAAWQLAQQVECGCYMSIHAELATLSRYKGGENLIRSDLRETWHLQFEGMTEAERFADWVKQYSDLLEQKIAAPFHALLKIALANQASVKLPPVEWAKMITRGLLYSLKWTVPHLIKRMCDEQEHKLEINMENFDAHCGWVYWRVPNFVIMHPSGNAPYNATAAWGRLEDAELTETILRGLTCKMVEPTWFRLDRLAGEAYVTQASVATVDLAEILNEDAMPPQQQSMVHDDIKTPVSMEEAGKAYPVRAAATPQGPQNSPPPTLLLIATQKEVEQARQQIRHFEAKIAAVDTKITALQQSLTQAIVRGTSTFRPGDIDKVISKLHENKKELEFRRDDWQLMLNGALIRLEAEQRRITGPSAAANAAVPDNGAPGPVSEANHAPEPSSISGLNYVSEVKIAIGFILSLNGDASDLQICRRFDAQGIVELPERWTTAGNRSFERAYKDPQYRHKIESLISLVRTDMRKKGLLKQI